MLTLIVFSQVRYTISSTIRTESGRRFLKGGGGGGGGGGGYDDDTYWIISLIAQPLIALLFLFFLHRWYHGTTALNRAKGAVLSASRRQQYFLRKVLINGKYESSHYDKCYKKICNSEVILQFVEEKDGLSFCITGSGENDINGKFIITEGKMAPNGKAYWIERSEESHILSRFVVNTGTFYFGDIGSPKFSPGSFAGSWESNYGFDSEYTHFRLKKDIALQPSNTVPLIAKVEETNTYGSTEALPVVYDQTTVPPLN